MAVLDSTGKLVMESILETSAATILQFFAGLRGRLLVTFEESTSAAWLYDRSAGLLLDSSLQIVHLSANEEGLTLTKYV